MAEADLILQPEFMRRLDRLTLETRRVLGGAIKGDRRSRKKGVSIDFADYRHYVRGDDLRFIDWNIYGRLDRLFIKIFHEDQDLRAHILIDVSRSMAFGDPPKLETARRIAAALAYVGLTGADQIGLAAFNHGNADVFPAARGRHHVRRMLGWLAALEPDGATSLAEAARRLAQQVRGRSIVVVISDFFDPAGYEHALRYLIRDTFDVYVLHVLAPQEIDPEISGHVELHDMELEHKVELTVSPRLKELYRRNVEAWCDGLGQFCMRYGMVYQVARSDASLEELLLRRLRREGLVKR